MATTATTMATDRPVFRPTDVVLVGCGGTASWLLEPLTRLLAYHPNGAAFRAGRETNLYLVDGDRWESRNAERQLCAPADVGRSKAETFEERVRAWGLDGVRVESCAEMVRSLDDAERILAPSRQPLLVLACVDNDAARSMLLTWLEDFAAGDWAFVTPGNAGGLVRGQVCLDGVVDGRRLAAPLSGRPQYREPDQAAAVGHCAAAVPELPQLLVANMLAATLALHAVYKLLTGGDYWQETFFMEHERDGLRVVTDGDRIPARRLGGAP